jgi:hypothetical protein
VSVYLQSRVARQEKHKSPQPVVMQTSKKRKKEIDPVAHILRIRLCSLQSRLKNAMSILPFLTHSWNSILDSKPNQPIHHVSLKLIHKALVVAISPEPTTRVRVVHHDKWIASIILFQFAKQAQEVVNAQPRELLVIHGHFSCHAIPTSSCCFRRPPSPRQSPAACASAYA